MDGPVGWFTQQAHAFLDTVEGKAEPLCSLSQGWQTLLADLAAVSSADAHGRWQEVKQVGQSREDGGGSKRPRTARRAHTHDST